ncbi:MAG: acetate--CoA ligase family protein [Deltaproteobacteria bacterium]|nr:acetate--CoA ligase family protein [Deltaproteobacteria bacterium]
MQKFFSPESVVVVGVSPREGNMGRNIVDNLDLYGFKGEIFQVSPRGGEYNGRPIYTQISDLPQAPELGVIFTPAKVVPQAMADLARLGTKRVIIESAGFSELSGERHDLEEQLLTTAREHDLRFIGPNCIGVASTDSGLAVPFPLLHNVVPRGGLSIVAQSGGIGLTFFHGAAAYGMGVAKFATVGNKLNVNELDLLEYLLTDPLTRTVFLYLESIVDGRRLFDLIRGGDKPVVVLKSNIAAMSHHIAQSHTAALANDDKVVEAALRQAGALRVHTITEAFQVLKALELPRPKGRKVLIISRSGGHAVVAADAAYRGGFSLPQPPAAYLEAIQAGTRAAVINLQNPVDLGDLFDFNLYVEILRGGLAMPEVDSVVVALGYRGEETQPSREFIKQAGRLSEEYGKPVLFCLLVDPAELVEVPKLTKLPVYTFPEEAFAALGGLTTLAEKHVPDTLSCAYDLDEERAARIISFAGPDGWLDLPEALHLVSAAGIPVAPFVVVMDPAEAAEAAEHLGLPVVLKAVGEGLTHKTEQGGVILDLDTPEKVRAAAEEMQQRLGMSRMLLMRQVAGGSEVILGAKRDPSFGPVVLFGLGGVAAEALGDVSLALAPVDDYEAGHMLDSLQGAALLKGFRGRPAASRAHILEVIMRLSMLMRNLPGILEMDLNPLLAGPRGVVAVDARVKVSSAG